MRSVAGYAHWGAFAFPLSDGDRSLIVPQSRVSGNFFGVLGVRPALGRLLRPEDDVDGGARVIVISYDVWQRQFHGDSSVIGRQLRMPTLDWRLTVVGVAPPGLDFHSAPATGCRCTHLGLPQWTSSRDWRPVPARTRRAPSCWL